MEPLLFKDEGKTCGEKALKLLWKHPPQASFCHWNSCASWNLGDVTAEKVEILQKADYTFIEGLKRDRLYNDVWQAGDVSASAKRMLWEMKELMKML